MTSSTMTDPIALRPARVEAAPGTIFSGWKPQHAELWGNHPAMIEHALHRHPLFSMAALAELVENYPRERYSLIEMGPQGSSRRSWREGDIGDLSGREVLEAIARGRIWINLMGVMAVDPRYRAVIQQMFDELGTNVPGFGSFDRTMGILISSPKAQVYYHSDLAGQSLWQIHGRKRVYLYPAAAPFLPAKELEDITLFGREVDMAYQPWFDDHALVHDLEPGQMLTWPLNAPHRVENHDCLNVSMTVEYWTDPIRRSLITNMGNAVLRHRFGIKPRSRATSGPGFWTKAVVQKAVKATGWVKRERAARRPIEFVLDRQDLGRVRELPMAAE